MSVLPILPPAQLGILGGGQLGRLFVVAARSMGYRVMVLDPDPHSPAGQIADVHLQADYTDAAALQRMAQECAAVTTEFENVPAQSMAWLAQQVFVSPAADCVAIAQDRIHEKTFLQQHGLATAPFMALQSLADCEQDLSAYLPAIIKTARFGYDGKGQRTVYSAAEVQQAFIDFKQQPCVLEKRLDLALEVSVVLARNAAGQIASFPVSENQHINGILHASIVPARISASFAATVTQMAEQLIANLNYVGVLAVEFFVVNEGEQQRVLINEIAPRPHNSGHYTLDATASSQFEQQVRMMCHLPPADTALYRPVVMMNLLGDVWPAAQTQNPHWASVLQNPQVKLYLYGKQTARIGRKMAHYNVLGDSAEQALQAAQSIFEGLMQEASCAVKH